jgi:hypothetical protein
MFTLIKRNVYYSDIYQNTISFGQMFLPVFDTDKRWDDLKGAILLLWTVSDMS